MKAALRLALPGLVALVLLGGPAAGASGAAAEARSAGTSAVPSRPGASSSAAARVIDDFETTAGWSARPSDGVELKVSSDTSGAGRCLRLDFGFVKGGGYALIHRDLSIDLPGNYAFTFRVRGRCRPNNLEFKLVDSTGANVWWSNRRDFEFPAAWETSSLKKRHLPFAWGPAAGGEIRHVAAIEFAVTAGQGGEGTVWLDDLELRELPPAGTPPPIPTVLMSAGSTGPGVGANVSSDSVGPWHPRPIDERPWLQLDLGTAREFGGLILEWASPSWPRRYRIEASDDSIAWRTLAEYSGGHTARDFVYLPETEARYLRVAAEGAAPGDRGILKSLHIEPLEWSATREAFFQNVARAAPRGAYPRAILGEQSYWTVVGADSDPEDVLLNEDGMLELGKGMGSIEPFLLCGHQFQTRRHFWSWADAGVKQELRDGFLPIPTVTWTAPPTQLRITAIPFGRPASILARYRLRNAGAEPIDGELFLAIRPFQVNPPAQFLNSPGGTAPIRSLRLEGNHVRVEGGRDITLLTPGGRFEALTFQQGDIVAGLRNGEHGPDSARDASMQAASGALTYEFALRPGDSAEVDLVIPLHPTSEGTNAAAARFSPARADSEAEAEWRARLDGVRFTLPDTAAEIVRTLRAQLAYILVNRAGPALQPGTRSYARSWIRDGALMSSALLRMGETKAARDFLLWFTGHLFDDGKAPCCVDRRGSDPVPENDSNGEYLYLAAEYYRYTGDHATMARLWPAIRSVAAYLDTLRSRRRTPEWRAKDQGEYFGLLPESISHEGYSAKPMHSYWDDFFALRGFKDAAWLAAELGHEEDAQRLARSRDEFAQDLSNSVSASMRARGIDYVPGCAELGDFDATSTTIALDPTGAAGLLPHPAVERTFEKYWEFFDARRRGAPWDAFTPYEMRNIGAFVRLGRRDRAQALLTYFLDFRRPRGWAHWAEVVWYDPREAKFIGDMPHAWVGSDYMRSVLDMFAYVREPDSALVLGAGIPEAWLTRAPGVGVEGLRTPFGPVRLSMRQQRGVLNVKIGGDLRIPPGGIRVAPPGGRAGRSASVNGRPAEWSGAGEVIVRSVPATVRITR